MKYWKLLFLVPVILLIAGCGWFSYDISLDKVNLLSPTKLELTNIIKNDTNKYTFEDERVKIIWNLSPSQFNFSLLNKTADSIEVVWDKSAYIDIDGRSHRLCHAGVNYADRSSSQPNSVLIPNTSLDDMVYPSDYISFVSGQYGGWYTAPLFRVDATQRHTLNKVIQTYVGKNVQALLAIKTSNDTYNYVFTFKINSCQQIYQKRVSIIGTLLFLFFFIFFDCFIY